MLKLIIVLLVFLTGCSTKVNEETTDQKESPISNELQLTEAQYTSAGIKLGKIELRTLSNTIKANGKLDVPPQNMVTVSAMLGGFVKQTQLLQGMKVRKGEIIAVLEDPNYIQIQQDYLENKGQLSFYETEFKRQQTLSLENINSEKSLQQAQSNFLSTKAKVEGLKAKLKLMHINPADLENGAIKNTINLYAPIDGFVTQVHVNIGMYVGTKDILFKIVDTKHLHAEITVFEKDILKIKIGQRVRLQLPNEAAERLAKVYLVGKEISPDRSVQVHCHLENEDADLLPGMYISAVFESGAGDVSSLPDQAIVNFEGEDFVFLVSDEAARKYKMIKVVKGVTESGFSSITLIPKDFDTNTLFVVEGAYDLLSYLKNTEEN